MKLTLRNAFAWIWIAALVLLIVGLTALDSLVAGQETKRVFVLNSYHRGYPFSDNAMRGIDDAFGKSGIKAETYVTYMDMKRIPTTPQYFSKLKELIRVGYKGARFDAVIACDNDALEFMRKYRDELFPGVPVVFTGINDFDKRMLDGRSDITGISQSNDYAGTIRIAQKFRPATKDIVVVTDKTTTGMAHRSAIVKIRPDFPQSLGFTYLSLADMTLDELAEKLSKLNSDSIVLLLHHFVDRNGTGHSIQESTSLLAKSSSVPIFVVSDIRMGFGTLGGHLVGGYSQGEAAAQIALKILGGTDVRTIPVLLESPNRFMFDYNVMKRFSIAEGDLPQGSIMINKPVSVLEEYKPQMFAILGTFIVLSGILVYMLLEIRRRKRAEDALQESEILFRSTFEQAAVGAAHVSLEGRFIRVNQRFCDIVGYSKEEMLPLTFQDITYPEDLDMDLNYVRQVLEGLIDTYSMEKRYIRKDGYLAWVNLTVSLLRAATGKPMHFISVVEDITERKQTEEALRKSEELLRLITDNMSDMIRVTDLKGVNLFTSPSHFKSLGYRPEERVGKSASDIIHPDDLEKVIKAFSEGLAANRPVSLEYRVRHADGHYVWLETVGDLLRDAQGNVTAVVMSSRDISQRKATAEELGRSEEKYRTLIETTRTGFVILDQDGLVLDANPEYVRLTGHHNLSEIVGKSVIEWTADHEKEKNAAAVGECFRKGYIRNLEIDYVDSKGNITPIEINATRMESGGVPQILTLCRDITDRKQAEEALRESEVLYRNLYENLRDGIAAVDTHGVIIECNRRFLSMLGYSFEEVARLTYGDITPERWHVMEARILKDQVNMRGYSDIYEKEYIRKDGVVFPVELQTYLVHNIQGGMAGYWAFVRDITDSKQAEEEKRILEERLRHADKMEAIGTLAGGIAHDFNNLLMGIQGHASLTLMDLDPSHPHYERLKRIEEQVQSGADLTKQLLGFARGGRYEVKPADMNDILGKSSSMFGRTKKEITIHRKYGKDLWTVEVDRGQMEQVFLNLYVNAWQAMPGGGEIDLETENVLLDDEQALPYAMSPGRYVKISVTDTGTGMDEKTRERIFDPFFTTKRMGRGTGLGLATVYGIIKGHKGAIHVYSEPGHGTTFTIYLPASEKEVVKEKSAAGTITRGTETILLVDDEKMVLEVGREMLEFLGYRVYAAGSGQEALAGYMEKRKEIDLVILDMIMPGISGGETFNRLREINSDAKVLLSSGYSINGEAKTIMDRGCNGFIQKPFQLSKLSRKVREMLD